MKQIDEKTKNRTLSNRIRGWFPSTPTLPQNITPRLSQAKMLLNPLPPLLENKHQRNSGIVIGIGLGLLMIGALGASFSYQSYSEVAQVFSGTGLSIDHYVLRHMLDLTAIYLSIIVTGIFAAVFGLVGLKSRLFRELTLNRGPYYRLGGGLMGGGGALALGSFRNFFSYLLAVHDPRVGFIELQLFAVFFAIGASLMAVGFFAWTRR